MKLSICCVGKIKEQYFKEAVKEYQKRLSKYVRLEILESADERTPDGASDKEEQAIKEKEGERLLKNIKEDAYVIALAIDGVKMSSVQFAKKIGQLGIQGRSQIQFVVGGSLGLSESVIKRADLCLSFSDMTFPHQLMRVILLEQVYRAFRILHNEPYHK